MLTENMPIKQYARSSDLVVCLSATHNILSAILIESSLWAFSSMSSSIPVIGARIFRKSHFIPIGIQFLSKKTISRGASSSCRVHPRHCYLGYSVCQTVYDRRAFTRHEQLSLHVAVGVQPPALRQGCLALPLPKVPTFANIRDLSMIRDQE